MTAKEKIIASITDEAKLVCDGIISDATKDAELIIKKAKEDSNVQCNEIIETAQKKAEMIAETGKSSALLIKRDKMLSCKRTLISDVLYKAKEKIISLPDNEYFDFLYEVIKKTTISDGCEMLLNKKDLSRKTAEFEKKIQKLGIKISKENADICGGFILKCGDIEINADIEALINEKREVLVDIANKILF